MGIGRLWRDYTVCCYTLLYLGCDVCDGAIGVDIWANGHPMVWILLQRLVSIVVSLCAL